MAISATSGQLLAADMFLVTQGAAVESDQALVVVFAAIVLHQREAVGALHRRSPVAAGNGIIGSESL